MQRSAWRCTAVVAAVALSALLAPSPLALVAANGCGAPAVNATCTDWQCSRKISRLDGTAYCVRGLDAGGVCESTADCYHGLMCNVTNGTFSGTCIVNPASKQPIAGYIAAVVASVAFGSNFIPTRLVDTGNGLWFQFFMSLGILLVGWCVQLYQQTPYFYPFAMAGGALWCTGNTLALIVIPLLGMGMGVTIWGVTNMIVGWAAGKFGMFGLPAEAIRVDWLSYVGVGLGAVAIVIFAFVEPQKKPRRAIDESSSMLDETDSDYAEIARAPFMPRQEKPRTLKSVLGDNGSRILGVLLAMAAGVFFGVNFVPPEYLMTHYSERSIADVPKYSDNGLDYVFSHFFGIFLTAGTYVFLFRVIERFWSGMPQFFTPVIVDEQTLPGFICGVGWAIAQTAWFIANTNIGMVAAFPIITLAPGVIATLWSIFAFKEISGAKNFSLVAMAFLVVGMSCACTVLAKQGLPS